MVKHLYIHIPFCSLICTYCDFYRLPINDPIIHQKYLRQIRKEIQKTPNNRYSTIYIGGGTPNLLEPKLLDYLLKPLSLQLAKKYEFTIEANPEFINQTQINIFKKNKVNRISLGVQTTNDLILKLLKRSHDFAMVKKAICLLQKNNFTNISLDFIYNLPLLTNKDLMDSFDFIAKYQIKHISYYALEIKKGSILKQKKYKIDLQKEEEQLQIVKENLAKLGFYRYEIANWAIAKKYMSHHNIAYWQLKDWKAVGISAFGFEKRYYYQNVGSLLDYKPKKTYWNNHEYFQNILIMGLRQKQGINLKIKRNLQAYLFFYAKLNPNLLRIENGYLKAKNFDLLNDILLDII